MFYQRIKLHLRKICFLRNSLVDSWKGRRLKDRSVSIKTSLPLKVLCSTVLFPLQENHIQIFKKQNKTKNILDSVSHQFILIIYCHKGQTVILTGLAISTPCFSVHDEMITFHTITEPVYFNTSIYNRECKWLNLLFSGISLWEHCIYSTCVKKSKLSHGSKIEIVWWPETPAHKGSFVNNIEL